MSSSSKTCAVPGCSREGRIVRSLCIGHYNRQLRDGTPGAADLERRTGAAHHNWRAVPKHRARGFCDKHYKQHRKGALQ